MSRYQWRFVWAAVAAYAVAIAIQWVGRPQLSMESGDTTWLILQSMLGQIAFWLGNLFAGGAVLLAVLRSDRADQYELDSDEPFEPDDTEPEGPFAGMID
ncbi:hypothetical protein [Longivirga aurantiaca]|uniref:Uncharacterized protein n=1 Tax=Longivirga aurantiaca TaxID=1837743 RepID=A0ABW1SX41_9ACTN